MFRIAFCGLLASLVTLGALTSVARGQDKSAPKKQADATTHIHKLNNAGWKNRHEKFLEQSKKGDIDVIFLGDSITHGWEGQKKIWTKEFGAFKPGNYGIGGDQTGHVLWRITEGKELEGINPKLATIMIGTNNMGGHSADQIAAGVEALVKELRHQKPHMKILVLAIFPRSPEPNGRFRDKIKQTNEKLAKLADGKMVFYKDIGNKFLEKDGSLTKEIMPDYLHLSAKGYQIWADAVKDDIAKLVK